MQRHGIQSKTKKKFKGTPNSKHNMPVAPNILNRDFTPNSPNKAWAGDIIYVWTREGWLYLAVVLDLFSRKVVGWSMDSTLSRDLLAHAPKMAMRARQPGAGLVSHSDRGSQYASKDFRSLLKLYEMVCSMSRKGNCWDNSVVESFFGTLKQEQVYFCDYATREEAIRSIFEWTHGWYNCERIHCFFGNMSPEAYERKSVTA
jgi:putative transposase